MDISSRHFFPTQEFDLWPLPVACAPWKFNFTSYLPELFSRHPFYHPSPAISLLEAGLILLQSNFLVLRKLFHFFHNFFFAQVRRSPPFSPNVSINQTSGLCSIASTLCGSSIFAASFSCFFFCLGAYICCYSSLLRHKVYSLKGGILPLGSQPVDDPARDFYLSIANRNSQSVSWIFHAFSNCQPTLWYVFMCGSFFSWFAIEKQILSTQSEDKQNEQNFFCHCCCDYLTVFSVFFFSFHCCSGMLKQRLVIQLRSYVPDMIRAI